MKMTLPSGRTLRLASLWLGCMLSAIAIADRAQAQAGDGAAGYPSRPIRWAVPSSAGGGNDLLARLFGARISENWGQQVVVDLRPGAAGILGSDPVGYPPDKFTEYVKTELQKWPPVFRAAGIKLNN